jgi:mono/diheme cytochrome c family protein
MSLSRRLGGIALAVLTAGSCLLALPQGGRSVSDGVYTAAQAARGQTVYTSRCAGCHAPTLAGRTGPPLIGDGFLAVWETQPLLELANKIQRTMPKDETERLTPQQAADVLAYMLQAGKFPAGSAELAMDETALKQITFPKPAVARATPAAAPMPALAPGGNMAQLMRGMLFPLANIVFTVQTIDPGIKKTVIQDSSTAGFDFFAWGQGIYQGWDTIDYAAVSLTDSAQLMLTPGRTCENGRPVPVTDPEWIRFTNELAEAGKAAYKASQTRDQETVSKMTDQLNNSCANCHRVYRGRTRCVRP